MMKSRRFEPIQEILASSADDLSRAMAVAGQRAAELERQLGQLETYRDDYVRNAQTQSTVDAVKLQNYRAFLDRLNEAIRQHLTQLDHARADYETRRRLWSEKRVEAASLGRAIDRFRTQELRDSEQRDQRESDDAAMRTAVARNDAGEH